MKIVKPEIQKKPPAKTQPGAKEGKEETILSVNLLSAHYRHTLTVSDKHSLYGDAPVAASVCHNVSGNVSQVLDSLYEGLVHRIASTACRGDGNISAAAHDTPGSFRYLPALLRLSGTNFASLLKTISPQSSNLI